MQRYGKLSDLKKHKATIGREEYKSHRTVSWCTRSQLRKILRHAEKADVILRTATMIFVHLS